MNMSCDQILYDYTLILGCYVKLCNCKEKKRDLF